MKLRLPKALMTAMAAAVVAAAPVATTVATGVAFVSGLSMFTVSTAEASSIGLNVGSIDTSVENTSNWAGGVTYNKNTGLITGLTGTTDDIVFDINREEALRAQGNVYLVKENSRGWGVGLATTSSGRVSISEPSIAGFWDNAVWGDQRNATVQPISALISPLDTQTLHMRFNRGSNTTLYVGHIDNITGTNAEDKLFQSNGLHVGAGAHSDEFYANSTYVTHVYYAAQGAATVASDDRMWVKTFDSYKTGIDGTTDAAATVVSTGLLQVNVGNVANFNSHGGDIVVGGSGRLEVFTYGNGGTPVDLGSADDIGGHTIYMGGSQHADAAAHGVLGFQNDSGMGTTIHVYDNIVLYEDSSMGTMGSGSQSNMYNPVQIVGSVSDVGAPRVLTVVEGDKLDFRGGVNLGGMSVKAGAGFTISNTAATIGNLQGVGGAVGGTVTVDGTTLTINGDYTLGGNKLVTVNGGSISFGTDATIHTNGLTIVGGLTMDKDGFLDTRYQLAGAGNTISLAGSSVMLRDDATGITELATLEDGVLTLNGTTYHVVTKKTHEQIHNEADALGTSINKVVVGENAVFVMNSKAASHGSMAPVYGNGTIELAWGSRDNTANLDNALVTFTGDVVVKDGTSWILGSGNQSTYAGRYNSISVESGGQIAINYQHTGDITISGMGVNSSDIDYRGALKLDNGITLTGNVIVKGDTGSFSVYDNESGTITGSVQGDATANNGAGSDIYMRGNGKISINSGMTNIRNIFVTNGKLFVKGTLTDAGTGKIVYSNTSETSGMDSDAYTGMAIVGNTTYTGEIVVKSGTLSLGEGQWQDAATLNISQISVQSGGVLRVRSNGTSASGTNIKLADGATLYLHDTGTVTNIHNFGKLIMDGDSGNSAKKATLRYGWKGTLHFAELTGEGNLQFTSWQTSQDQGIVIDSIVNYKGTVTDTLNYNGHTFKIGNVHQDSGYNAVLDVTRPITSTDFRKTGEGGLTLSSLSVSSSLYMRYDGSLSIGTDFDRLTVANGTTLHYDNAEHLILLGTGSLTGATALTVDIDKVFSDSLYSESGYNLGISSGYTGTITVTGLTSGTDYTLDSTGDYWHIKMVNTSAAAWDANWGVGQMKKAPTPIDITSDHLTSSNVFLSADTTTYAPENTTQVAAIKLTGEHTGTPNVYGGKDKSSANQTVSANTWILLEDGAYGNLVGGNFSSWGNTNNGQGYGTAFEGDSHIEMKGGSVINIVGGNSQDCRDSHFLGSTYISVYGGTVSGSIVGASTAVHNGNASYFQGDTNIFIYTPLEGDGAVLDTASGNLNYVIGGRAHIRHGSSSLNANNSNNGIRILGSTNITIDTDDKTGAFAKDIVGGNYHGVGDNGMANWGGSHMLITGDTHVSIKSSADVTYSGMVVAGSRADTTIFDATDAQWVEVEDRIDGSTYLDISGGTFTNVVVGGSYVARSGKVTITGGTNVNLTGGAFTGANSAVFGGSYFARGESGSVGAIQGTMGKVSVVVDGATVEGGLHGGTYVGSWRNNGDSHKIDHTAGIEVLVKSGTVNNVYGGSQSASSTANILQGAVVVDLQGGTVNGNVYAAGEQSNTASTFKTGSTTVKVSSAVVFGGSADHTVSGGYTDYGTNTAVTGTSTLVLGDSTAYTNLTKVNVKDFDIIQAASNATVKSISQHSAKAVEVQGSGNLTVTGNLDKVSGITVYESNVTLNGSIDNAGSTFTKNGSGTLTLIGGTTQVGMASFVIEGGMVDVTGSNTGNGVFNKSNTTITVKGGGTLKLAHDALGWNDNATAGALVLQGENADKRAVLINNNADEGQGNTMSTAITMKGYSSIVNPAADSVQLIKMLHATVNAESVDNIINTNLSLAADTSFTVAEGGELDIQGQISGGNALNKLGDGEMKISSTGNSYSGATTVSGGTLKVTGTITSTASVAVSGSGVLEISGADASVTAGGTKVKALGDSGAIMNLTIGAKAEDDTIKVIAGATSTSDEGDLQALGAMSSVDLTAVASMELSNVTMYDSTIHAGANTITYSTENGSSVVAVASTAKSNDRMAGRIAAADPEGGTATAGSLTATTVHDGGTAKGELTVDIASSLFSAENAGKTLTWTILDNVLMSEDGFSLLFGRNVKYLLDNGKDVSVALTLGDATTTYSGTELVDNLNNFNTGSLLATDQRATLILTVENIPEPATGALSVLALAALAARRRRKSDK